MSRGSSALVWVKGATRLRLILSNNSYWQKRDHLERLWVVLALILERWACGDEEGGFCPILSRLLEKQVGRDFAVPGLRLLVEIGFLECDGIFCPRKKALGYRFTPAIATLEAEQCRLSDHLADKQVRFRQARTSAAVDFHPAHAILWNHLRALTIHPLARREFPIVGVGGENQLRRDAWTMSIDYVDHGRWYFSDDPKSGRVFNNVTSLPKSVRRYILLGGQPCVEIDIRNSQPFFSPDCIPIAARRKCGLRMWCAVASSTRH